MKSVFNKITRVATSSPNLNLNDILDVNTSTASAGEVLSFNGSQWVSITAPGKDRLDQLQDVDVSGLQADSILFYDGEYWIDARHVLTRLNDVVISNPQNGQALVYDSTAGEWKNMNIFSPTIENPLLQWDAITWNGSYWCNRPSVSLLAVTNFLDYFNISATDVKGDITLTFTPAGQDPHTVFSVGGSFANPRFRLLEVADLPAISLNNLSNVNINTPINGQVLTYDTASSKWVNTTDVDTLATLTDVQLSGLTSDQILTYNSGSSKWNNTLNYNYTGTQLDTNINPVNTVVNKKYYGSGNYYFLPTVGVYNGARVFMSAINGGNSNITLPNGTYLEGHTNLNINIGAYSFIEVEFQSTGWFLISGGGIIRTWTNIRIYPKLIEQLPNVTITTPSTNTFLRLNGYANAYGEFAYINSTVAFSTDMSDVFIETPISGQALAYNGSAWENTTLNTSNISDINITTPSNGDILSYNSVSAKWENSSASRCLPTAEIYLLGDNTTANKTLTASGTWYIFDTAPTTFVANPSGSLVFNSPSGGAIQYTGPSGKYFHTAISVSASTSNANANYQLALFKNNDVNPIPGTYFNMDFANTGTMTSTAFHKVLAPATNDIIYIKIRSTTTNNTVITYNNVNYVMMACCN